jgi:hypothetical protein
MMNLKGIIVLRLFNTVVSTAEARQASAEGQEMET